MSNQITIKSHKGEYSVSFIRGGMDQLNENPIENAIYIVDQNIAKLYGDRLSSILSARVVIIKANEENKSLNYFPYYVEELVKLNVKRGQMLVAVGGGLQACEIPYYKRIPKLQVGDFIAMTNSGQIWSVLPYTVEGSIRKVIKVLPNDRFEVETEGGSTVAMVKSHTIEEINEGDRIIADEAQKVIIECLGPAKKKAIAQEITITWEDVGGLNEAKLQLQEAVEHPYKFPEVYKHYNKGLPKGVLLYGPPGNGKTMLAKAVANAVGKIYNKEGGFIYIKGPEILTKWVGETEGIIRGIFAQARKFKEESGAPAVVFIDEADAVLNRRGSRRSSDVDTTIVPMFLAEMDGLEESSAIILLATNRSDALDPAVVRDGRIDRKIYVSRPDMTTATAIFNLYFNKVPLQMDTHIAVETAVKALFDEEKVLYQLEMQGSKNHIPIRFHHISSGAMIAGIVDHASMLAMRRDLANDVQTGIGIKDIQNAVAQVFEQNTHLDHQEAVHTYMEENGMNINEIRTAHRVSRVRK